MSDLPRGWSLAELGDILVVLRGVTYKKEVASKYPRSGYLPLLRATNIGTSLNFDDLVYVPEELVSSVQRLQIGDIVVAASSGSRLVVGKAAQMLNEWNGSFGAFCFALRPSPQVDAKFVNFFLQTKEYRNRVSRLAAGVNINNLRREHIESTPIPIPPFAEQRRIVAEIETQFTRLDAAVAALERARSNLKRYRAAVLAGTLTGTNLTDAETTTFGNDNPMGLPVPVDWKWSTLSEVAALKGGITKGNRRKVGARLREVRYLRVANVQRGWLDLQEVKSIEATEDEIATLTLQHGDVLFNEGGDRDKLGRGWVWEDQLPECIHQNHVFRARLKPGALLPKYLSHFGNVFGQSYFMREGKQTTNLASINLTKLGAFPVPVPCLEEQAAIIESIEQRLSLCDAMSTAIEVSMMRSERLRQSCLRRAFAGGLVPQCPEDEPASILLERIRSAGSDAAAARKAKSNGPEGTAEAREVQRVLR